MNENLFIKIWYVIKFKEYDYSFFNEYPICGIQSKNILEKILELPKNAFEIFCSKEHLISERLNGLFDGYFISFVNNADIINNSNYSIKVIFITELNEIDEITTPSIFISDNLATDVKKKLFNISDINLDSFKNHFRLLVNRFDKQTKFFYKELEKLAYDSEYKKYISTDLTFFRSIYTYSNLITIKSLRVMLPDIKDINYIDESNIEKSINFINHIKINILKNIPPEISLHNINYIITDMSNSLMFSIEKDSYKKHTLSKNFQDVDSLIEAIKIANQNKLENINPDNSYINDFLNERLFIESLIAVQSSSYIAPNIKIPLANNKFYSILKDIGTVDRSTNVTKLNKLMIKLTDEIELNSQTRLDYLSEVNNLKIVSNLPIEWANHLGLPLMIRHEVSRIPVSPGYVSTKLLLDTKQVFLTIESFKEILVISSFKDDDPIKHDLESKISIYDNINPSKIEIENLLNSNLLTEGYDISNNSDEVPIKISKKWFNISNKKELIDCLNSNSNLAITVFDLHGGHSERSKGIIQLKDEIISVFDLVGKVKLSPIVILSSCDTSPIDRNHYTTANAFLLAGAKTVLASALPIKSHEASIFITRLIFKIEAYLPTRLLRVNESIRWSSLVTQMLRQSYYYELLNFLQKKFKFDGNKKKELMFFSNLNLHPLSKNWHDNILNEISAKINICKIELIEIIRKDFTFPECIKYLQLGNPELIVIASESQIPLSKDD